jgi:hypothetical protein
MLALDRRAFVMGLATVSILGLPIDSFTGIRSLRPEGLVLLGHRRIPLSSNSINIPLRRQQYTRNLVFRTKASGYWLDRIEFTDAHGIRSAHSLRRRILPGLDLDLVLNDTPPYGWSSLILHHAYLPLTPGQAFIEIWARTA